MVALFTRLSDYLACFSYFPRINYAASHGEVAEWSKAHAWKVCNGQPFEGSNPSLTAIFYSVRSKIFLQPDPVGRNNFFFFSQSVVKALQLAFELLFWKVLYVVLLVQVVEEIK